MAGIIIEDQVSPKRCGHTAGKSAVSFKEACDRIQSAVGARKDSDARGPLGFYKAFKRCEAFIEIETDMTVLKTRKVCRK